MCVSNYSAFRNTALCTPAPHTGIHSLTVLRVTTEVEYRGLEAIIFDFNKLVIDFVFVFSSPNAATATSIKFQSDAYHEAFRLISAT